jgi:hypothetical protein
MTGRAFTTGLSWAVSSTAPPTFTAAGADIYSEVEYK